MKARFLLVMLVLTCRLCIDAQDLTFRHLKVEDGLSQNTINCIYQDHYGFMWFGTQDGLNCYDGFKFTIYRSDPEDSATLSHNWIWDIIEDEAQNLWIATWNGLSKYDRTQGTWQRFLPDSSNKQSISGTRPASLARDQNGNIWVGMWGGGLNMLDPQNGTFQKYGKSEDPDQDYPGDYVRKLYIDARGWIWIGTWNGLWRCRNGLEGTPVFEHFINDPDDPASISSNRITSFMEDPQGRMWIGTLGGGLNLYEDSTNSFKRFLSDPGKTGTLSSNDITSIESPGDGTLWIGTVPNGLNRYNLETGLFYRYREDPAVSGSLASDNVFSVFADRGHVVWVGAGGLNIFNPHLLRFTPGGPANSVIEQVKGRSVYAIFEDSRGNIWVGTNLNGLARFHPEKREITWYKHLPENQNSISNNSISAIAEDRDGAIWISTQGGGLNRLDPSSGEWSHFRERSDMKETSGLNYISGIVMDEQGVIWIATSGDGIICYNPDTQLYRSYRHDPLDPASLSGNYMLRIFMDSRGDIWAGTWGAGLNRFDRERDIFTRFAGVPGDSSALPDNIVHAISEERTDSARLIWVGTSGGLVSFDPENTETVFTRSPVNKILPSRSVYGMLFDQSGKQWISNNAGISLYNPGDSSLKHYTYRDGLPGSEYNAGAFHKLKNGLMAFGGIGGLLLFHPDSVRESTYEPPLSLTSFSLLNEKVYEGIDLNAMEQISLSHKQNFFSFEFASMDFSDTRGNRFMYKMDGIDEQWIESGVRNFASYTKIDPGDYHFRVKGSNSDGRWSRHEIGIGIHISPPFWQRWWFRGLLILAIMSAVYAIHQYRIRRVREMERLRTRIASDLHDDIGSALTRISVHSQQIMGQKELERIKLSTEKINDLSRDTISTMSDIVWSIDARNDTLADFLIRMQDLTHNLLSEKDINVLFEHKGLESKRVLHVEVRQNLYYIFKEAIHNIVKHSDADQVEIRIKNSDPFFHMIIADNGKGFDPDVVKSGNGLRNMKMRAERIGATLDIKPGGGSVIELRMKSL